MSVCIASNGSSYNLLKLGTKRRRTKAQVQQEREEAEFKHEADERKNEQIRQMQEQLHRQQAELQSQGAKADVLDHFISKGKLKQMPSGQVVDASDLLYDNEV
jgi:hypothetical protein